MTDHLSVVSAFGLFPTINMKIVEKIVASLTLSSTMLSPMGNIGSAYNAIIDNPDSIMCTLDTAQTTESHGSCQLLDNIVRFRAGKVLTVKQVMLFIILFASFATRLHRKDFSILGTYR